MNIESLMEKSRFGAFLIDDQGRIVSINNNGQSMLDQIIDGGEAFVPGAHISDILELEKEINPDLIAGKLSEKFKISIVDYYKDSANGEIIIRFIPLIVQGSPDMVRFSDDLNLFYLETDTGLNICYAGKRVCEVTGRNAAELISANIREIIPDKFQVGLSILTDELTRTAAVQSVILASGKKVFPAEFSFHPLFDGNEKSGYAVIVKENADPSISELNNCRKLNSVGIFAGGVAHDYNNALTVVLGNLSLARLEAPDNADLIEALMDAESAAVKIKMLTERLNFFAKGLRPVKKKSELKCIIDDSLQRVFYGKDISVKIDMDKIEVDADENLVGRALDQIFENSLEAMDSGTGSIDVTAERVSVEEEISNSELVLAPGEYIVVSIHDNGCGMDENTMGNIFIPYFSTKEGRLGMGLALVYAVLKRHRGFIDAQSDPGRGSLFRVYLPLF